MNNKDLIKQYRSDMHDIAHRVVNDFNIDIDRAGNLDNEEASVSFDAGYYHALAKVCNDLFSTGEEE